MSNPQEFWRLCRSGQFTGPTAGQCPGYVQANLTIIPKEWAFDFMLFCHRNSRACPLLDVTEPGDPCPALVGNDSDLRTDLPKYRVYKNGDMVAEVLNVQEHWRSDFVCFLTGCSFSFEDALVNAGIPLRHINENKNVAMYITNKACKPAGRFQGPLVVSMRPMTPSQAIQAVQITSQYKKAHGAPVHIGDPNVLGIMDISKPDFGDPVDVLEGEVPVFWACGVTTQIAVMNAKVDVAITHAPGHMFITALKDTDLNVDGGIDGIR